METVVTRRKRGIFGWFFLLLFIGFNLLMLWAASAGLGLLGHVPMPSANVVTLGVDLGAAIGVAAFVICWLVGFLLLGLFAFLTRGRKVATSPGPVPDRVRPFCQGACRRVGSQESGDRIPAPSIKGCTF